MLNLATALEYKNTNLNTSPRLLYGVSAFKIGKEGERKKREQQLPSRKNKSWFNICLTATCSINYSRISLLTD